MNALQACSFQNDTLATVGGANVIAKLATFLSYSQGFRCDVTMRVVGPPCSVARGSPASTGFYVVRLVTRLQIVRRHQEDPLCFEMNQSKVSNNREGAGIYAGLTDIPPTFYNRGQDYPRAVVFWR